MTLREIKTQLLSIALVGTVVDTNRGAAYTQFSRVAKSGPAISPSMRAGKEIIAMPIDEVSVVRMCGACRSEIETITVKKDNMRLFVDDEVWCEGCQCNQPGSP